MLCGHCGGLFEEAARLAHHINRCGFKSQPSKIRNYNRETFNPNKDFQLIEELEITDSPFQTPQ